MTEKNISGYTIYLNRGIVEVIKENSREIKTAKLSFLNLDTAQKIYNGIKTLNDIKRFVNRKALTHYFL